MSFLDYFRKKKEKYSPSEMTTRVFPMDQEAFQQLVFFVESREAQARIPDLSSKKSLEIAPRQISLTSLLNEKKSSVITRVGGLREKDLGGPQEKGSFVQAHWENLPFLDHSWDFVFLRTVYLRNGFSRLLRESGRVLASGGKILMSDFHPFSQTVQSEHLKSVASEESLGPGFERYFKLFREAGLKIEGVKEIFYEGSHKKFFGGNTEMFDKLKKTPFLIFFTLGGS